MVWTRRAPARSSWEPLVRRWGATTAVGLLLGTLVGGVGGRIAMRVLFLTSDERVRGVVSDDGFVIGQFTSDTLNLLAFGAFVGVLGAFTYLAVRPFLLGPPWLRVATCAAACGIVVGGLIVTPDGVDFTELSPVGLAVALFVAIPAAFGALMPLAMEPAIGPAGWAYRRRLGVVAAPLIVFLFPPVLVAVGVPLALVMGQRHLIGRSPRGRALLEHSASVWLGRAAWASVWAFGGLLLLEDLSTLGAAP